MSSPLTIEGVKTALKIGTCSRYNGACKRLWTINWEQQYKEKIVDNAGRIYLIVSRRPFNPSLGIIKKIGKSESRGGMKSTFSFYQSGLGGSPSIRTFGIHHLIAKELEIGNNVEIWGIWSAPVAVLVPGLFDTIELFLTPSIHSMEERCRNDYKSIVGDYPPWNFQERAKAWPKNINMLYRQQVANRPTEEQREAKKEAATKLRAEKTAENLAKKEAAAKLRAEKTAEKLAKKEAAAKLRAEKKAEKLAKKEAAAKWRVGKKAKKKEK